MAIHINYIEMYTTDMQAVKDFYTACFDWGFVDYGPGYAGFTGAGIDGGFELSEGPILRGALVVLSHKDLEGLMKTIQRNGGQIAKEVFSFPGGRRFEFIDPVGNGLAVWCESE